MATKKRWYDEEDMVDAEDPKTPDLLEAFVGSLKKSTGYEAKDPDAEDQKTLVYPQTDKGKILAGPPKEAGGVDNSLVRFYDDKTDRHEYSSSDKIAMALIGLGGPLIGGLLGGKVGAYAGGAQSGSALANMMEKEQDRADKVAAAKALNKSKIMTAMELQKLGRGKDGMGAKVGTYQWVKGSNKKGEPVFYRVNRVTGEVDKANTLPGYSKEYYDRVPQGGGVALDDDGVEMPPPPDSKAAGTSKSSGGAALTDEGNPPPTNPKDDRTFDYSKEPPEKKPANVAGKLPENTMTEGSPGTRVSAEAANTSADILAEQQRDAIKARMPQPIDLNPSPRNGESFDQAKQRAADARKLRDDLNNELKDVNKNLLDFRQDLEKADKGLERSKALAKFKKSLDKNRIMKNADGELVDVDANPGSAKPLQGTNPKKAPAAGKDGKGGKVSAAQQAKMEDKLIQFDTAIADMEDVIAKVGNNSKWVGIIDGRAPTVDEKEAAFRSALGQMNDSYRHAITGAGAGNAELRKLESRLPSEKDLSLKVFKSKAHDYIEKMKRQKDLYMKGHKMAGGDAEAIKGNLEVQKDQVKEAHPGMVRFRAPTGEEAWIPKDRVEYYQQKAGGKGQVLGE
jgi:hypothetical protein